MNILVLCPMQQEYQNFMAALTSYKQQVGKSKHSYWVRQTGIGKANAASTAALEIYNPDRQPDLVCLIGYAAGTNCLEQGAIVMPDITCYHDVNIPVGICDELTKEYGLEGDDECKILTGDSFVTAEMMPALKERFGKVFIVDMEAAAVAQVCDEAEVPLLVIKMISDIPEEQTPQDFNTFVQSHPNFEVFVSYLEMQ